MGMIEKEYPEQLKYKEGDNVVILKHSNSYFIMLYVSEDGKICYNYDTGRELSPVINMGGYIYNNISNNPCLRHRLVASVWLDVPENSDVLDVHHINGDKTDNRASNLQWVNKSDNFNEAIQSYRNTNSRFDVIEERINILEEKLDMIISLLSTSL